MTEHIKSERDECERRLKVYHASHDEYGEVTNSFVVDHEIILYQQGGLETKRGCQAAFALGLSFTGRYNYMDWVNDLTLLVSNRLPDRVYAPLLMDKEMVSNWLFHVSEDRYKRFVYQHVSGMYKKIIRYYFTVVIDALMNQENVEQCKRLIEWTTDFWWSRKNTSYDFFNLTKQTISKNYLEKFRATCNLVNQVKPIPTSYTFTNFDIELEKEYKYKSDGYRRRETVYKKNTLKCNTTLYPAELILLLWICNREKKHYDPTTMYNILALKEKNIVHQLFHSKSSLFVYDYYQCDEENKIQLEAYFCMLSSTPMCRPKNAPNANSALRIRCIRDALYRRYQLAPDEEEYKRFLNRHFDILSNTLDKPTMLWDYYKKSAIQYFIEQCRQMDQQFVENENTIYVQCVPKHKTNAFQQINRVNEFDIEWKQRKKRKIKH